MLPLRTSYVFDSKLHVDWQRTGTEELELLPIASEKLQRDPHNMLVSARQALF